MAKIISKIINNVIINFIESKNPLSDEMRGISSNGTIYESMIDKCIEVASEGIILLKNDNNVLPIENGDNVAVFGRCAYDYFDCGYGSGGGVKKPYTTNLYDGLNKYGVNYNKELANLYNVWRLKPRNIPDQGFWGHWPLNYKEMKLTKEIVNKAKEVSNKAIIVIGRAAGEDRECKLIEGSYYLTKEEREMLKMVTSVFDKTILILDIGNIMDFSFINDYNISSVLLPYQGGQESGIALGNVLSGNVSPSGKLTDTIAFKYEDYPSSSNFLGIDFNNYVEDIFVGYRFFETFAKDKVMYPFGYGLTYTNFKVELIENSCTNYTHTFKVLVKNVGKHTAKEVVELYLKKPGIKLSEPERELVAFAKTKTLNPGESEEVELKVNLLNFATYDDKSVISDASYVLEKGTYTFYLGENVRDATEIYKIKYNFDNVVKKVSHIMPLKKEHVFKRMVNNNSAIEYEDVPTYDVDLKKIILNNLPKEIPLKQYEGHKLSDVKEGKISLEEFVSELTLDEMNILLHGAGAMNSPLGTKGNAGAMGGLTESLREKGIPPYIVNDGPQGMKVELPSTCLPSGVLVASTWDTKLVEELFFEELKEMANRKIVCLLAPGMNIHRNPLCGRNFEYFSEDPLLSGSIAASVVRGVGHDGFTATPKHFFGNNQETNRTYNDSRMSERCARDVYLKNFEHMLRLSEPKQIMTSYNMVNSIYSHNNYYLTQIYLRDELGYKWNVMTDWWMRYKVSPEFPNVEGNAYRVRSRCDVLMPGSVSHTNNKEIGNSLLEHYGEDGAITLGEIERCVIDLLKTILDSVYFD